MPLQGEKYSTTERNSTRQNQKNTAEMHLHLQDHKADWRLRPDGKGRVKQIQSMIQGTTTKPNPQELLQSPPQPPSVIDTECSNAFSLLLLHARQHNNTNDTNELGAHRLSTDSQYCHYLTVVLYFYASVYCMQYYYAVKEHK